MTEFWNLFTLDCNCSISLLGYIFVEQFFFLTNIFVRLNSFVFIVVNMIYSRKMGNLYLMSLLSLGEWWKWSWELWGLLCQIFLFPLRLFFTSQYSNFVIGWKVRDLFSELFLSWIWTRNVFSEIFSEFTLGKVRDLNSELLFVLVHG
jgi:hypothetical protein